MNTHNVGALSDGVCSESRILAVDDIAANLVALEAALQRLGHELVGASSGQQALELAREGEFAVILLDVMMPYMDGFETLARLRDIPLARDTPVIFITAHTPSRATTERAYALGAFDFIEKPVAPEVLRGKVAAFLALHSRGCEIRRQAEAIRHKDRHIGMLAHDLRTPLNTIAMQASLLNAHEDPAVRVASERLTRAAGRMNRMTNDLLEFARSAEGPMPLTLAPLNLTGLLHDVIEEFHGGSPHVQFEARVQSEVVAIADRDRIYQAVSNLVANAIKFGDGRVALSVTEKPSDGLVEIKVENSGSVIPADAMSRLFSPYIQGENRRAAGVGLGLFIVSRIATAHGGHTSASSNAERTTFSFSIPLTQEQRTAG